MNRAFNKRLFRQGIKFLINYTWRSLGVLLCIKKGTVTTHTHTRIYITGHF
uniref:Uncharacterized protein n=1 Tax=Aquilaria malaccensis TaxID=223753 RepID=A0A4Y6GNY2_9ROSI|nr:hypothetical protein [Aquilaria malaccensis]